MDGTLTLPHQLDFDAMRKAAGLPDGAPIFAGIEALQAEKRAAAWAAIEAQELQVYESVQLQPGLAEVIKALQAKGLRIGIATRNHAKAVDVLLRAAGLPIGTFEPVLTREGPHPDKPHPAIAHAAASAWNLSPESCLMVGDSLDDMKCGRAAGMSTCLLRPPPSAAPSGPAGEREMAPAPPLADEVDFAISALAELSAMIDDAISAD